MVPLRSRDLSHLGLFLDGPQSFCIRNRQCKPNRALHGWTSLNSSGVLSPLRMSWSPSSFSVIRVLCSPPPGHPTPVSFLAPHLLFSTGLTPFHLHHLPCYFWNWTVKAWLRAFERKDFLPGRVCPDILKFSLKWPLLGEAPAGPSTENRSPALHTYPWHPVPCFTVHITPCTI